MEHTSGGVTHGSSARSEATPRVVPEKVAAPELVRPRSAHELVRVAVERWRESLVRMAGGSPLRDVDLLEDAVLDLTGAHPSGIAQLYTGRATRLSNIFRDAAALPTARRRIRLILERAREQSERFGLAPMYLVIGLANWTERGGQGADFEDLNALMRATDGVVTATDQEDSVPVAVHAPVLLRPISIRSRGKDASDFELTLEPTIEINPVLARALRSRGALLDPEALAQSTFDSTGFIPGVALDRLDALGRAVFADFRLSERNLIGTFVHPGQALVDDLDELTALEHHELIAALAGHAPSLASLAVDLPDFDGSDVEPNLERGVGDLEPSARRVLEALATGGHLFVDAPVGTDTTGLIAAVAAEASAIGRSVLYVPGHRRSAAALKNRLAELGLEGLVLDVPPDQGWRAKVSQRLLGAMTHDAEPVDLARISAVRRELTAVRNELARTMDSLHAPRADWGVSAYEALQALVKLTSEDDGPRTRVRFTREAASRLDASQRRELASQIVQLGQRGGLGPDATHSGWFGADLADAAAADRALERIDRLLDTGLVELGGDIAQITEDLQIAPPANLRQWGEQLATLAAIRGQLGMFLPVALERSAEDLIAATAPKQWREDKGIDQSRAERRRLIKHAKDLVRPGMHVEDLHVAFVELEANRRRWYESFPDAGWPRIPQGLPQAQAHYAKVLEDITALQQVLASTSAGGDLVSADFAQLADRLDGLRVPGETLYKVQEHSSVMQMLDRAGVRELVEDLGAREVPLELVMDELELAWWSTAFNQIVAADPYLSQIDGARIETLAARFRALDTEHLRLLVQPIQSAVSGHVQQTLTAHGEEADELFAELIDERLTSMRTALEQFGDVVRALRPVLIATPSLVPELTPPHRTVDLVIIDAAQHLSLETVLSALARGRQVVVVGDPRCASGTAIGALSEVLTSVSLRGDWAPRDPNLTQFLIDHGYESVLRTVPLPQSERLVSLHTVDGRGMHDEATGLVESTQAEVDRVVELAIDQAVARPEESLSIVASNALHAQQIRTALLSQVRRHPTLASYFDPRRAEPVVITDLAGAPGVMRDAVIYAVGFGRTPHGRVLYRFGAISERGGEALLLSMLGVVRRRLTVVSCFTPEDLDRERIKAPGAIVLADLLQFAHDYVSSDSEVDVADHADEPNQLLVDLAARLWNSGLTVEVGYGIADGDRIALAVGHPDFPGEFFVAVLTDDDAYIAEKSVRVRDRQRATQLERLGWTVMQVWSVSLFLDPERQANRIRQAVLSIAQRRGESVEPVTGALPTLLDERSAQWVADVLAGEANHTRETVETVQTGTLPIVAEPDATSSAAIPVVAELPEYARQAPTGIVAPTIRPGLPVTAYTDDELDDLVRWIAMDGQRRDMDEWIEVLREHLAISKRSTRVDAILSAAVRRIVD
ncbi:hypothetical protein GCM10010401_05200 [Rarobacter faecitabidus]|uniref:Restriction endonuclease type II-like domain-containing protein n=1 Tax=Rarobacter faecitabidus TaxID=13243 RepID=A0A542ZTX3_RARFA|nr:hypothetical protein [Rarobacter faecitabidus]TQL63729.1 hypothetical protein FB461_0200 [Rarobacter faecitabidus]